ncbi:50S ribosomal protein L7/L12 [Microcoleus sp. FACHB-831]|uniref:50S ribosomal protein L7/L12 n=1 Tax=Microcoleus sp. FACHB-831 TaxID=2692827 RepID=UPI001F549E7A|nr:50S ribosomal protein L7/L12 [Microcoleus sp. FACHB-831]
MKPIKKGAAGFLLTLGFFFLLLAVYQPFGKETKRDKIISQVLTCLVYSLPLMGAGSWLAWESYKDHKQEIRDRVQSTFYRLIKEGDGNITVLNFAMEAKLTAEQAKQYLDEKAKEFDGSFNVSEEGGISYYFLISGTSDRYLYSSNTIPTTEAQERCDVILEDSPNSNKIAIIKAVREITGLGLKHAKDIVEATPQPVKKCVTRDEAESIKAQLEKAGAKVNIR